MIEDTILILLIALITALFSEGMLSLVTVCSFNPYWLGEGACWKVVDLVVSLPTHVPLYESIKCRKGAFSTFSY